MHVVSSASGRRVEPGCMIHIVSGPYLGQAWRYSHVREVEGAHRVHCTRRVSGKRGRVFNGHREFHPSVFGLEVKIEISWQRHALNTTRHTLGKVDDYLLAGAFALLPLAFFEHYHMASKITETLSFGGPGH